MGAKMWGYSFEGPVATPESLAAEPGVFVVLCELMLSAPVLDVGQGEDVRAAVASHGRQGCWHMYGSTGGITYMAHYTADLPETERVKIEQAIRSHSKPLCGERSSAPFPLRVVQAPVRENDPA